MKKKLFKVVTVMFSLVMLIGLSACGKAECGLCGEEHSKLTMREGIVLGQEMLVCEDCYEEIKNMWN